jgi:serine/threonine protein phosphatase PrpC
MYHEHALTNRLGNRDNNQDRCAVVEHGNAVLLLLADGMGGHARGELAAQVFINSLTRQFEAQKLPIRSPSGFIRAAITQAHHQIVESGLRQKPPVRPRTTGIACLVQNGVACWAHVGDSRLYLIRNRRVAFRTRDHSHVSELIEQGMITEEEAGRHPLRNFVSRSLGGETGAPEPTIELESALQTGDMLILCSDGLWSALPEKRLSELASQPDIANLTEQLASEAEYQSYPHSDNISIVTFRWLSPANQKNGSGQDTYGRNVDDESGTQASASGGNRINQVFRNLASLRRR